MVELVCSLFLRSKYVYIILLIRLAKNCPSYFTWEFAWLGAAVSDQRAIRIIVVLCRASFLLCMPGRVTLVPHFSCRSRTLVVHFSTILAVAFLSIVSRGTMDRTVEYGMHYMRRTVKWTHSRCSSQRIVFGIGKRAHCDCESNVFVSRSNFLAPHVSLWSGSLHERYVHI